MLATRGPVPFGLSLLLVAGLGAWLFWNDRRQAAGTDTDKQSPLQALGGMEPVCRVLFDLPFAVSILDEELRYIEVNEHFLVNMGLQRAEVLGRTFHDLFETLDGPQRVQIWSSLDKDGEVLNQRISFHPRGGAPVQHTLFSARALQLGTKRVLVTVAMDNAQYFQAQEMATREKAFNEALLGSHPGLLFVLDEERRLVRWNEDSAHFSGFDKSDIVGRQGLNFIAEEDQPKVREAILQAERTGRGEVEADFLSQEGKRTPFLFVATRQRILDRSFLIGNGIDLTEHRKLESQVRQSQKMEAIGRLAGGVAHDFNNLLTVISGYVELVLQGEDRSPAEREDLVQIQEAADRAASLTRQLLAFSRQQILRPQDVRPDEIVRGLDKMLRRLIGEDIDFQLELAPDTGHVLVDPGQLEQVVLNLAVNARDAMPRGGHLTISTSRLLLDAELSALLPDLPCGPYVLISVSDSGEGMTAEVRERIFDPFFTTKEKGKGTGLGLATVMGIIKQSLGHVEVQSEPGMGSCFRIYLPEQLSVETAAVDDASRHVPSVGHEVILLVEDENILRTLVQRMLEETGYQVVPAINGPDALEKLYSCGLPIDLLLTDVVMPGGMNGAELAMDLLALQPALKVLYMSGYTSSVFDNKIYSNMRVELLQKPFSRVDLIQAVRRVLDS